MERCAYCDRPIGRSRHTTQGRPYCSYECQDIDNGGDPWAMDGDEVEEMNRAYCLIMYGEEPRVRTIPYGPQEDIPF